MPDLPQPQEHQCSAGKIHRYWVYKACGGVNLGIAKPLGIRSNFSTPFTCGEPTSAYELPELLEVEVLPPWAYKNVAVMLDPALPSSIEVNNRALMVDLGSFFALSWLQPRALGCLHATNPLLSSGLSSEAWTSVHSPCPYQQVSVSSWEVQGGGQDLCAGLSLYSACHKTPAARFSKPLKLPLCLGWTSHQWMEFPG